MFSIKTAWLLAASWCAIWTGFAQAQAYPNKPIRVMVGYAPGGSADAGARPLAKALEPLLGQPIIIDYKPGNAGGVAMDLIAKAPADGYTLYFFDSGPLTVAPHMGKVTYDVNKSFSVLGHVCGSGSMLVVHPGTPFKSVSEVVTTSKREPDKWSYGTSGVGGPHHLSGEYFKSVTGAVLLHVPYKGGGPAMADLMGGQVPMLFSSLGPVVSAAKAGKVRPLAVTSLKRSNAFPDVPTLDELGFKGFESVAWYGLMGPAGLPAEVVTRLTRALSKVGEDKAVMDQINATGCDAEMLSPDQTLEKIRADSLKWSKVIKDANIKAE
ncbi:MAG: tripartite tricarboxylate transporter substrate binding protein [Betaproteobacteria bacterium]|jgi:tripartite-type tricarboxylate transporter receptor subunit TctC|nr:tripartite tricarboxylate transporter substrate binding protein [Betaproteobacteria bacterium]